MFPERIEQLSPYTPSERVSAAELHQWLLLDWNESTFTIPVSVSKALYDCVSSNLGVTYSDSDHSILASLISKKYRIELDSILLFSGSDSALRDTILALGNQSPFLTFGPEYSQIDTFFQLIGARHINWKFCDPFKVDLNFILGKINKDSHVYMSNPNNPTGRFWSPNEIKEIAKNCKTLLLDEAYVEFASCSCERLIDECHNVIIFRTFSKLYGLAGFRIGYVLSQRDNISALNKVRNVKEINSYSLVAAKEIFLCNTEVNARVKEIVAQREGFIDFINDEFGGEIIAYPSEGNFVIIKTKFLNDLLSHLRENMILIRDRSSISGLESCARVTIGDAISMQRLKGSVKSFFEKMGSAR